MWTPAGGYFHFVWMGLPSYFLMCALCSLREEIQTQIGNIYNINEAIKQTQAKYDE